MGYYKTLLFSILFSLVLICKSWQHSSQENEHSKYSDEQKRDDSEANSNANTDDILPIYVPEDSLERTRNDFSAVGKGLNCIENVCEDAKDYPYQHILCMLKRHNYHNRFVSNVDDTLDRQKRNIEDGDEEGLCETTITTSYPKTLLNQNRTEKYIVNVDGHKQGVVFETCVKNAYCRIVTFPTGYVGKCVQKYSTVRLLAIENEGNGEVVSDSFIVPSACVCNVKKDVVD